MMVTQAPPVNSAPLWTAPHPQRAWTPFINIRRLQAEEPRRKYAP